MSSGLAREQNLEKQIEKQMGCMAGFLQLFDRHHIVTAKRFYSPKRLPPSSPMTDTTSESEISAPSSPAISRELAKPKHLPETPKKSPTEAGLPDLRPKSPLPLPIFELKEGAKSSWKFCKEAPRLSLDSRATTDAKGGLHPKEIRTGASIVSAVNRCDSTASDATDDSQQHRSPGVIERLMGLEALPTDSSSVSEPETKPELRRSASSESRVSRDLFNSRFVADSSSFSKEKPPLDAHYLDPRSYLMKNGSKVEHPPPKGLNKSSFNAKAPPNRKSFFDSGDFFPEVKQSASIENRLKMRAIDEPSKDLETLRQILEALQLKGLLHSRKPPERNNQATLRNFVYDDSPMRPSRLSSPAPINRRTGPSNGANQIRRRNYSLAGENSPSVSPRRERSPNRSGRNPSPTTRPESNTVGRRSNSLVKPKALTVETQRRGNVSPVHSPKYNPRRTGSDPTANNRSPRSRKKSTAEIVQKEKIAAAGVAAEDESSSISGSSITTSTDTEQRSKTTEEEYREGRTLLERCDKLLNSIAEMNAVDMQPSPVSVLDSSFYKDESSTPSPVTTRRNIDFKDNSGELEDDIWNPAISPVGSEHGKTSNDSDFTYVSDILRASRYLPEDSDVFLLLEKQQYLNRKDTSKVPRLQRKLIFDTINEILNRDRQLPPWKVVSCEITKSPLNRVWCEFQRIREREIGEDLFETICAVLEKDLAGDRPTGWGDCAVEMSEAILDIERLIFKDLVSETIGDLAALASSRSTLLSSMEVMPRRKLVF